eukprot:460616-Prorocentrum_minimum.AAC.1
MPGGGDGPPGCTLRGSWQALLDTANANAAKTSAYRNPLQTMLKQSLTMLNNAKTMLKQC